MREGWTRFPSVCFGARWWRVIFCKGREGLEGKSVDFRKKGKKTGGPGWVACFFIEGEGLFHEDFLSVNDVDATLTDFVEFTALEVIDALNLGTYVSIFKYDFFD